MAHVIADWNETIKCPHCKKKILLDCQETESFGGGNSGFYFEVSENQKKVK